MGRTLDGYDTSASRYLARDGWTHLPPHAIALGSKTTEIHRVVGQLTM